METTVYQEEGQEKHFRRQLSVLVRAIQWSYAIFWSISTTQLGVLTWSDGYYNGDIKTRKTTQPMELEDDQMGLQRSEQLRDLYLSLSTGDINPQSKRPTSLSPEDLTDSEWYYLVCMSFTFSPGRGLPGRAFASNEQFWLSNAQFADSKTFTRSLLAKSASIQTVVCIPFMNGILELGTTESVLEDLALVNHITTSFWEMIVPVRPEPEHSISSPSLPEQDENNPIIDATISPNILFTNNETEEVQIISFDLSTELTNDDFYSGLDGSLNPTSCMSQKNELDLLTEKAELDLVSLDLDGDPSHYAKTLAEILKNSMNTFSVNSIGGKKSSFSVWIKDSVTEKLVIGTSQNLLKKVLSGGSWINNFGLAKQVEIGDQLQNSVLKINHVISDKRRKEKLNDKLVALRLLVPSTSKVDRESILNETIEYVKELERRVEELESVESKTRVKNHPDTAEKTSDNYHAKTILNRQKTFINKRKARDVDEIDAGQQHHIFCSEDRFEINVTMCEREALISLHCQWREFLLLEIFEAIGNLYLDPVSVQSSINEGALALTIKAKFVSSVISSPGMIKEALQRIARKY